MHFNIVTFKMANIFEKLVFVINKNKIPFMFCTPDWSYFNLK